MISGNEGRDPARSDAGVPQTDKKKMALAGVLLAIPVLALLWVPSYAKDGPELWDFPFFFWYQFAWVFCDLGGDLGGVQAHAGGPE